MTINLTASDWGGLFEGRRAFGSEIRSAKEIASEWLARDSQVDIALAEIPGTVAPLWGSDLDWLYVRRPEGIWKTSIPDGLPASAMYVLCQKSRSACQTNGLRGGMLLGPSIRGHSGWIFGKAVEAPTSATEIDEVAREAANTAGVDVHALGKCLGPVISDHPGMLLVASGDYFSADPTFSLEGDWLVARDRASARAVALPLKGESRLRKALEEGRLWLRFQGLWMAPHDVHVKIEEESQRVS